LRPPYSGRSLVCGGLAWATKFSFEDRSDHLCQNGSAKVESHHSRLPNPFEPGSIFRWLLQPVEANSTPRYCACQEGTAISCILLLYDSEHQLRRPKQGLCFEPERGPTEGIFSGNSFRLILVQIYSRKTGWLEEGKSGLGKWQSPIFGACVEKAWRTLPVGRFLFPENQRQNLLTRIRADSHGGGRNASDLVTARPFHRGHRNSKAITFSLWVSSLKVVCDSWLRIGSATGYSRRDR